MKKLAIIFALVSALSFTAFAEEGDMNTGGRTCQPTEQQPCPAPDNPPGVPGDGESSGQSTDAPQEGADDPLDAILDYLDSLFG